MARHPDDAEFWEKTDKKVVIEGAASDQRLDARATGALGELFSERGLSTIKSDTQERVKQINAETAVITSRYVTQGKGSIAEAQGVADGTLKHTRKVVLEEHNKGKGERGRS